MRIFEGHTQGVTSVSLSVDGRWALSGSDDKTVRLWEVSTGQCMRTFERHTDQVFSVCLSNDGRWALSGGHDKRVCLYEFDWDYEFPGWSDWDERARPYLDSFLTIHCPYGPDGMSRVGKPIWNERDFKKLVKDLQHRGYGWLRPEGIRKKLEEMASSWQGPPPVTTEAKEGDGKRACKYVSSQGRFLAPDVEDEIDIFF